MTDDEIDAIYIEHRGDGGPTAMCENFARAIIAAHTAKLLAGVEMPEPIGRTMRFIGNNDYARKHSYCARTYEELPKGMYSDTWQDLEQLFTKDQLQQYAAAAAVKAREKALDEAKQACTDLALYGNDERRNWQVATIGDCAAEIDRLKGGE